jgi:hypothetical protein
LCFQAVESSDSRYEIEMCLRAMAAVYDVHAHHVGPCKGVPYLVSMLDHTDSSTVRTRLVSLIVALVSPKAAFVAEAGRAGDLSARSASSPKMGAAAAALKAAAAAKANGREIMAAGAQFLLQPFTRCQSCMWRKAFMLVWLGRAVSA